jgi:choline dehydrogenase-like flavoprotein
VGKDKRDYLRGFGYQGRAARAGFGRFNEQRAVGADLKKEFAEPGPWNLGMTAFGEILPYHDNHMRLDRDEEGQARPAAARGQRRRARERTQDGKDMRNDAAEMLEAAGYKNVKVEQRLVHVGNSIHEMGTARMGSDPKKSVLNKFNQVHACKNVFVTDGSFMVSSAARTRRSPTWRSRRARGSRGRELKKGNL